MRTTSVGVKEYWSAGVSPASCFFAGGTSALHHEKHLSSSRVAASAMTVGYKPAVHEKAGARAESRGLVLESAEVLEDGTALMTMRIG
jgi:hypothetical protein